MLKVYIVGMDNLIHKMFLRRGWNIVNYIDDSVSLVQFTGGEDVDPAFYKETAHAATNSNPQRDAREAKVYHEWVGKIPMAGICRGAQFLNVMNGGKMWQHVTNHNIHDTHPAFDLQSEKTYEVTSTHHQMMIPTDQAEVLLTAQICRRKETADLVVSGQGDADIEAVLYKEATCLCYQPHPEDVAIDHECQDLYFHYLTHLA